MDTSEHRIDHNGSSRLNALSAALMATFVLLLLYKLGVYCSAIPDGNFSPYVQSGWVAVGLSGVASFFWFCSAGLSHPRPGPDAWASASLTITILTFFTSLIWMIVYTLYFAG